MRVARCARHLAKRTATSCTVVYFAKVLGCFMPQDVRKFVDVYSIDMEEAGYMVLCSKIKHHLKTAVLACCDVVSKSTLNSDSTP